MRTAQELYDAYRIMPSLQLHQLRVAATSRMICDAFSEPLDTRSVILACLFHDMGNIIKSNLTTFPDFVEPEGFEYWKRVKDEYLAKYGTDEHHATMEIAGEIGLQGGVLALMDGIGFSKLEQTRDGDSFEQKIVEYSDQRVGPYGILSMDERLGEARKRYKGRILNNGIPESRPFYDVLLAAAHEVERQIFGRCSIRPEGINDVSAAPLIEELRNYQVD